MLKLLSLITASCTALLSVACTWERGDDPPCDRCGCGSGIEEMNASEPVECGILVDRSVYCWKASPCYVEVEIPKFPAGRYVRTDFDDTGTKPCALREDGVVLCFEPGSDGAGGSVVEISASPTVQFSYGWHLYASSLASEDPPTPTRTAMDIRLIQGLPRPFSRDDGRLADGTWDDRSTHLTQGGLIGPDDRSSYIVGDNATSTYVHFTHGAVLCGIRTDGLLRCTDFAFLVRCPGVFDDCTSDDINDLFSNVGKATDRDVNEGAHDDISLKRVFANRWWQDPLLCGITDDDAIWCGDRAYIDDRFKHVEVYPESVCGLTLDRFHIDGIAAI